MLYVHADKNRCRSGKPRFEMRWIESGRIVIPVQRMTHKPSEVEMRLFADAHRKPSFFAYFLRLLGFRGYKVAK